MFSLVQIGDIAFNQDPHYWITDQSGLGNPPTRTVDYDMPGENFGLFVSSLYARRPFTLTATVIGDDAADLATRRDIFAAAMDTTQGEVPVTFTLANGLIKQIFANCKVSDPQTTTGVVNAVDFQMQFSASFPFFTNPTVNQYTTGLPVGGGGTVPLPTVPTGLLGNSGGSVSVVNNGNAMFWPLLKIFGPVTDPQILNKTLNLALELDITISSGQYLLLDTKRKTIVDNFGTNQYSSKSGDWWVIMPGANPIEFSAASYSSSALLEIFSQDCYLSA